MAPTPDRTTIKAALSELISKLRTGLAGDPPTAAKPFRRVEPGPAGVEAYPRPFLTARLVRTLPIGTTEGDKIIEAEVRLYLVTDVTAADPHDAVLDKIGAVDDYLDTLRDTGVLEGAEGFDNRVWTIGYPKSVAGARVASAESALTCVVKVEREQNREPAG